MTANFGPVSEQDLKLAFSASRSQNLPPFTAASCSLLLYQVLVYLILCASYDKNAKNF